MLALRLVAGVVAGAVAAGPAGCGGAGAVTLTPGAGTASTGRTLGAGRPDLAIVSREGDAQGGVAVAVDTEGIATERGAAAGVALAALVEARLTKRGFDVVAVGGWGGWRLRALAATPADAASLAAAIREAMLAPVAADEPALAAVRTKLEALARRPLPDRALAPVAWCTGEAWSLGETAAPSPDELERWRAAAHGTGRVAFASVGKGAQAPAVIAALAAGPGWPAGGARSASEWPTADAQPVTYDASGDVPPGAARIIVMARTSRPERAVAGAGLLGDPRGPLVSRLAALDAPARVVSVLATAHPEGGCLAVTLDVAARDLQRDGARRIALAATLARQEITVELAEVEPRADDRPWPRPASDPRDAAEQAAWWALAGARPGDPDGLCVSTALGAAPPRDASPASMPSGDDLRSEVDRATVAWHSPVVEARTRVERGQGETWVLLASPCGTAAEGADAGSSAAATLAAVVRARATAGDAVVEPFVAADGAGVLVHGPARPGESGKARARRLGDLAARSFAADAPDATAIEQARAALLADATAIDARVLGAGGTALTSGHASWLVPTGTREGLASLSHDDVVARAAALRGGPLRVAVVANDGAEDADAAVRAVDRWIARRPGEVRACPSAPSSHPHPGTYAVDLPGGTSAQALLLAPFAPDDRAAVTDATWIAAALGGARGWLAHALAGNADRPLATSWDATVVGWPRSPALAIRIQSVDADLDAAVAQTRAVLDRVRQGAVTEDDRARASAAVDRAGLDASLDPRARVVALWRGEPALAAPSLDTLRAFAGRALHDEDLVIVAARPPRAVAPRQAAADGRNAPTKAR